MSVLKRRARQIEWEIPALKISKTSLFAWLGQDKIGSIVESNWDDHGNVLEYTGHFQAVLSTYKIVRGSVIEKVKEGMQSQFETWWAGEVAKYTEPIPFAVTMIAGQE